MRVGLIIYIVSSKSRSSGCVYVLSYINQLNGIYNLEIKIVELYKEGKRDRRFIVIEQIK